MANEATPLPRKDPTCVPHCPLEEQAQAFFEQLAASINTPHVGDVYRDTIRNILLRATEAGLYTEQT
jgi:hypothetical protein